MAIVFAGAPMWHVIAGAACSLPDNRIAATSATERSNEQRVMRLPTPVTQPRDSPAVGSTAVASSANINISVSIEEFLVNYGLCHHVRFLVPPSSLSAKRATLFLLPFQ
jgi:hypothetical protein